MNKKVIGFAKDVFDDAPAKDENKHDEVLQELDHVIFDNYQPAISLSDADTFFTTREICELISERVMGVSTYRIHDLMRKHGYDLDNGPVSLWMLKKK